MTQSTKSTAQEQWSRFLLEYVAAEHYPHVYLLAGGSSFRNPLLERLLPSLLFINALSLLDDAMKQYIDGLPGKLPKNYQGTLDGRISFLTDTTAVSNGSSLHTLRKARNEVAHTRDRDISWSELARAIKEVEFALQTIGVVGPRPNLEYFGERSAAMSGTEPGVISVQIYKAGVRENGTEAYVSSWKESLMSSE